MSRFLLPADYVARYGTACPALPLSEAREYTRWLARSHYENFHVVSILLPRRLHQDFYNVYAFCRWADDLADEIGDPQRSLELLAWWRHEVEAMYSREPRHPVFTALAPTVAAHKIPKEPFTDLIRAFEQDQTCTRYESYSALLDYCRYSANPVGRLVLHLCGYTDSARIELSDFTCTALQLVNFWQDVRRDWMKGRVYMPLEDMASHEYSIEQLKRDITKGIASSGFRESLQDLTERTEELFRQGLPLVRLVDRRLAVDIDLFSRGGLAILERIRGQDYDVIRERPKLGAWSRARLLAQAIGRNLFAGRREQPLGRHRTA